MKIWERDDAWQKNMCRRFYDPFYERVAFKERFVRLDKSTCSKQIQKQGIDTTLQVKQDWSTCIEEKMVRWPGYQYDRFFFETDSCTIPGHESQGWMRYTIADALFYGCALAGEKSVRAYLIKSFQEVKQWFWTMYEKRKSDITLQQQYKEHTNNFDNRTRGLLVPIYDVMQITDVKVYLLSENSHLQENKLAPRHRGGLPIGGYVAQMKGAS